MPTYSNSVPPSSVGPGEAITVWNVEAPAIGAASQQVALVATRSLVGVSLQVKFSAAPAAAVVNFEIATDDVDSSYFAVDVLTFTGTQLVLRSDPAGLTARFARAKLVSHTGSETVTAIIERC